MVCKPSEIGEMALGPPDAKVTILEYASTSCPHCARFHKETLSVFKRDYTDAGKIRFIFRELPHNQAGLTAFMIARCAPKEKYSPLVSVFFETQETWLEAPAESLYKIAQLADLTRASFDIVKDEKIAKGINAVRYKVANEFGVKGVPTLFVNCELFTGAATIEEIKAMIDPLLARD